VYCQILEALTKKAPFFRASSSSPEIKFGGPKNSQFWGRSWPPLRPNSRASRSRSRAGESPLDPSRCQLPVEVRLAAGRRLARQIWRPPRVWARFRGGAPNSWPPGSGPLLGWFLEAADHADRGVSWLDSRWVCGCS